MTTSNAIHQNDNYDVKLNTTNDGYEVINRTYGVVELESVNLPECIFAAENLNVVLVHKTYEWVGKRAAEQAQVDKRESAEAAGLHVIKH